MINKMFHQIKMNWLHYSILFAGISDLIDIWLAKID